MAESIVLERLLSPAHDSVSPVSRLKRQRVYILPTREGYLLALVLLTMLLGAINYNNSMAYMFTFLLGSVFLIGILHTYRNLAGLILTGSTPRPVFAGETARFPLMIDNHGGRARPALQITSAPGRGRKIKHGTACLPVIIDVKADQWLQTDVGKTANKRGLLRPERLAISTSYPLGLFRAWSYLEIGTWCVVYPRPDGIDVFPAPAPAREQGRSGIKTGADDFAGFRHYHAGDSIRTIAWKALARAQPLLVKRFSGDGGETLMLTWQDVMFLPDNESRLCQLCRWIVLADQQDCTYGLDIPGLRLEPASGPLHRNQCLEALAHFGIPHAE